MFGTWFVFFILDNVCGSVGEYKRVNFVVVSRKL